MKTYCFDLDGTLCTNTDGNYNEAEPFVDRIKRVNQLYDDGNRIIIQTARGSTTEIDWCANTMLQLEKWGLKYHLLDIGKKPYADFFIDDKGINDKDFF